MNDETKTITRLAQRLHRKIHNTKRETTIEIALLDVFLLSKGIIVRLDETHSYIIVWVPSTARVPLGLAYIADIIYKYDAVAERAWQIKNRFGLKGTSFEYKKEIA